MMIVVATATGQSLPGDARVATEPPVQPSGKHHQGGGGEITLLPLDFSLLHALAHLLGEQQVFAFATFPSPPTPRWQCPAPRSIMHAP